MIRKHIGIWALAAAIVVACVEPELGPIAGEADLIPINITGSVQQIQTKATAAGFVDKDAVGLYAVNYSSNNTVAGTLAASGNQADNVKYVFDEPNHKWVPARPVYYKDINTHVDLYCYYPYQSTILDVNVANFEVQKDQSAAATTTSISGYEASDWMWGTATDVTPVQSSIQIPLFHRLSAIQVTLTEGTGFGTGEYASLTKGVIVTGTTRKATLNYATGEATPVGGAQLDGIVMCPQNDGSFRAVVIPQTVAAETQLFAITVNGTSYSFKQDAAMDYLAGKQTNVSLTINKKSPAGDYEIVLGGTTITDWTEDRNSHGGEARQYFVVNLTTAGTLQATIEAAGKNPAKIRNLKVTGQVNADDFKYMKDNMGILESINMKESRIIGIAGRSKDNAIPDNAFGGKRSLVYYVFPELLNEIGSNAFSSTFLSGSLDIPDAVTIINDHAFTNTGITIVHLPSSLEEIGEAAFNCGSLSGQLLLPDGIKRVEKEAFLGCKFSGQLVLPESLEYIGSKAFCNCGVFDGGLVIPPKITSLGGEAFSGTLFNGPLTLSNLQTMDGRCFEGCYFTGDLIIPEGTVEVNDFSRNRFSSVRFPSTLKRIYGLRSCSFLDPVIIPEGVVFIGNNAFENCSSIPSLTLPSTLLSVGNDAFKGCYTVSGIICSAIEPPTLNSGAFNGVAKDNFTVEVPAESVMRYRSEPRWQEFKRIDAHYDFSINRTKIQTINDASVHELRLKVPAGFDWSIQSKPEWVSVSPSSGVGKTDVTISISAMPRTNDTFEVNEGTFTNPKYKNYKGRIGEVVFLLNDKDYTSKMTIEQYDCDDVDGGVHSLQSHSVGPGIDIVFIGDGYSAPDLAKGTFLDNAIAGYNHFFEVEPYKTYKEYFNVYAVSAMSNEGGVKTLNRDVDNKFGSIITNRIQVGNVDAVLQWAKKANSNIDLGKSLVVLLVNTPVYDGVTYMYADGTALACCPVSTDAYPYDFRGIIQHEAGGHGFGKLGDEYIYYNAFIQDHNCGHDPQGDDDMTSEYGVFKSLGWYKNLSMNADPGLVPWSQFIYHTKYADYVDMYEGAYYHTRGIYRSEVTSCMNNNIPYFSAISRQAIVERIMNCSGQVFSIDDFYAKDKADFGPTTKAGEIDRTFGVNPDYCRVSGRGPILMGDHPNVH